MHDATEETMTTTELQPHHNSDVLLHVDLDYTAAVLEDWPLAESAIAQIHRIVAAKLDRGHIDAIIADLITDTAEQWQGRNQG